MGEVVKVIRRVFMVVVAAVALAITVYNCDHVEVSMVGTFYMVHEYADTYYEMLSDNVGMTTVNGISNVYVNMEADGYAIYKETVTDSGVDVSFIKEGCPSYRYYYSHPDGRITFFSSDYENSFSGLAYIIDKKE